MIYKVDKLIIDHKCRGYCKLPYHGHKNGCPNFGKHPECPPNVKTVEEIFDLSKDLFFITEEFDLKSHVEKMKSKHSNWSPTQCKNLLYWQGGVRKRLKEQTEMFVNNPLWVEGHKLIYTLLPEAMGVMVIDTALDLGIPIERQPINKVIKIALIGYSKQSHSNSIFDF